MSKESIDLQVSLRSKLFYPRLIIQIKIEAAKKTRRIEAHLKEMDNVAKGKENKTTTATSGKMIKRFHRKILILSALFVTSLIINQKITVINDQGIAFLTILKGIAGIKIKKAKMRQILQMKVMEITCFIQVKMLNVNQKICGTWIVAAVTT